MTKIDYSLKQCLFFTANNLARVLTRLAEQEFRITGLSPAHAFTMMTVNDYPGTCPKEMADKLHLAPSTITRFIDFLEFRGYLTRNFEGKSVKIYPTPTGETLQSDLKTAWHNLYIHYSKKLGKKSGDELADLIHQTIQKLEES